MTLETCDLWDIWSEWWGDMTWPKKDKEKDKDKEQWLTCDIWDTDYNWDNWEPEFMTIFVTWQWRMTRDSILNSWDVYWLTMPSLVLFDCTWHWPMFLYITIWFEYFCMEPEKVILQFPLLDNFKYSYLHIHCATPSYFLHILSTSHGWFSNPTDLKSIMWVIGSDDNSDWTNFWEVNGV